MGVGCRICVGVADTITAGVDVMTDWMMVFGLDCDVGVISASGCEGGELCSPLMSAKRSKAHPTRLMKASPATVKSNRCAQTSRPTWPRETVASSQATRRTAQESASTVRNARFSVISASISDEKSQPAQALPAQALPAQVRWAETSHQASVRHAPRCPSPSPASPRIGITNYRRFSGASPLLNHPVAMSRRRTYSNWSPQGRHRKQIVCAAWRRASQFTPKDDPRASIQCQGTIHTTKFLFVEDDA